MSTIRIFYKSGNWIDVRCKSFTATRVGGALTEVKWDDMRPKPLFFGVDEVEAIYEVSD